MPRCRTASSAAAPTGNEVGGGASPKSDAATRPKRRLNLSASAARVMPLCATASHTVPSPRASPAKATPRQCHPPRPRAARSRRSRSVLRRACTAARTPCPTGSGRMTRLASVFSAEIQWRRPNHQRRSTGRRHDQHPPAERQRQGHPPPRRAARACWHWSNRSAMAISPASRRAAMTRDCAASASAISARVERGALFTAWIAGHGPSSRKPPARR